KSWGGRASVIDGNKTQQGWHVLIPSPFTAALWDGTRFYRYKNQYLFLKHFKDTTNRKKEAAS
ncbi:hypothetical protein, partial [Paenibacillus sp. 1001270B_150601_E10]|uniref:hypothetical protein n=1 Tax=Paenibacillus sp. 1001270B_150601_E10 TaxID=2787079 RepID=UPI001E3F8FDC